MNNQLYENENEYELTNYSSNSTSNVGSYVFEWVIYLLLIILDGKWQIKIRK